MAARENEIGHCRCPLCKSTRANLRVSAKQLAYITCNACQSQTFCRSDVSDGHARALRIEGNDPAELEKLDKATTPAALVAITEPTPAAAKRPSWGMLGA